MQNNAFRIVTGYTKISSVDHLHEEFRMLSVRPHNKLLTKQYLVAWYLSSNPNHHIVTDDSIPRRIRQDFRRTYDPG